MSKMFSFDKGRDKHFDYDSAYHISKGVKHFFVSCLRACLKYERSLTYAFCKPLKSCLLSDIRLSDHTK